MSHDSLRGVCQMAPVKTPVAWGINISRPECQAGKQEKFNIEENDLWVCCCEVSVVHKYNILIISIEKLYLDKWNKQKYAVKSSPIATGAFTLVVNRKYPDVWLLLR